MYRSLVLDRHAEQQDGEDADHNMVTRSHQTGLAFIAAFKVVKGLLLLLANSAFSQDRRLYQDLADSFRKVEVGSAVRDGTTLSINSNSRLIRFDIAPHDLRSSAYKALDAHASGESLRATPAARDFRYDRR